MDLFLLINFISIAILLTLMPGPDILFVTAQSITQGKYAGIATAFGLCTGLLVHITAATVGISALIYQSSLAFSVVKYAGAAYLLFLAYQSLKEKGMNFTENTTKLAYRSLYKKGIFMNILNPKVSLFFLALLPQFVSEGSVNVPFQMAVLGFLFLIQAIVIFTIVSIFSAKLQLYLKKSSFFTKNLHVIKAAIYAFISFQLAIGEK